MKHVFWIYSPLELLLWYIYVVNKLTITIEYIYSVVFVSETYSVHENHTLGLLQKDDLCFTPAYEGFGVWVCIAKICSYACM